VGISTDPLAKQQQFAERDKLPYPLMADSEKTLGKAFGAVKGDAARASRHTFLIDKDGTVKKVFLQVTPAKHAEEVLKYVQENLK
jgi:peroxiredoxin Q/BCP